MGVDVSVPDPTSPLYEVYGLTIRSAYPFRNPLCAGTGVPDLTFSVARDPPFPGSGKMTQPLFRSGPSSRDDEDHTSIYRTDGGYVIHYSGRVDFYLVSDRIIAHLLHESCTFLVEIILLGEVLSLWLELHGIAAVHASAVVLPTGTAAFLSTNKGGKSTLAASLLQAGYPLLTDDILPVEREGGVFYGRPSFPGMRMWPHEACFFLGRYEDLEVVHPAFTKRRVPVGPAGIGVFCPERQPVRVLYVPKREEDARDVTIESLSRKDAFIELVRNSFSAVMVEALGLGPSRMRFFAEMTARVPMRSLVYPSGFDQLPKVMDAIIEDTWAIQGSGGEVCGRDR